MVVGLVEVVLVLALLALLGYGAARLLTATSDRRPVASSGGHWCVTHYDRDGRTLVVLQKVAGSGAGIIQEHVVASLVPEDAEFDEKFMLAMEVARERRALFEAEEQL